MSPRRAHRRIQRRRRQHDRHPASGHGDGVQLAHAAGRKLHVGGEVLPRGAEEHGAVVGRERARDFARGVIRQPLRFTAVRRHDEDVEIAVPVGRERHRLPIVAPHRCEFVRLTQGQRDRMATRRRHRPDITLVFEEQNLAIGRNSWIPQPQRRVLSCCSGQTREHDESDRDGDFHSVAIIHTGHRRNEWYRRVAPSHQRASIRSHV